MQQFLSYTWMYILSAVGLLTLITGKRVMEFDPARIYCKKCITIILKVYLFVV
jgi:hypothetical protein